MADERIIVTGCSGFVGRNTVKMLLSQGHHVVGFSRSNPNIEGLEFIKFDITDENNFNTSEYREATIINTAALTTNDKHGDFEATNYNSVVKLLSLNPDGKFIHISSSSIYDLGKASEHVKEEDFQLDRYRFYNPYGVYKAKAENALLSGIVERRIPPISLRPHAIYGKDDTTLIPALRERVKNRTLILPDSGRAQHSLTNINNLLQAIELGLSYIPTRPEAFNVTDANPVTIAEAATAVLGDGIAVKGIPTKVLLSFVGKLVGASPYEVRQLGFERTYDLTRAKTLLGYNPSEFIIDWK
jgi:nucleoside-diphosphate-sugar epimerase